MKVKVGGLIFNSDETPIMIQLDDHEKTDIASMSEDDSKFCVYPEGFTEEEIVKFMSVI